jgi:TrmH family RNA methyltransferase
MKTIASRHHPIVRAFRDLADRPDSDGVRLLLDGAHLVREAIDAGLDFEQACVASSHLDRDTEEARLALVLQRRGLDVVVAPEKVLAAISPVRTASGIVAIAKQHRLPAAPDNVFSRPDAMVLVGADIQDPGNVGALLRVAEAAGAHAAILTGDSANPFSWKALRGSMGSGLRLPVINGLSLEAVFAVVRAHQVRSVAAVARGGTAPSEMRWTGRVAVLVGGEGSGLDAEVVAACDERVTIPMAPPVESLNVTVAAAILLYAARQQRAGT